MADERNILLISSDQHNPRAAGYAGHPVVRTPNLDALAERGTEFTSAYCSSPICVPSRASLATGRYAHEIGTWDNSAPYAGEPASWGHHLRDAGYQVASVGKLHYRDGECDTGIDDQRLAMHVHGRGDIKGVALRSSGQMHPPRTELSKNLLTTGPGESEYTVYDRAVGDESVRFLSQLPEQPWMLFASFVTPHFPLIVPDEFYDLYDDADIPDPEPWSDAWRHPAIEIFRDSFGLIRDLTPDEHRRALRSYWALTSFMDAQVGRVLDALEASGQSDRTLVVYTSDHGESAGAHGQWFKHLMNEESVRVPLILAGAGIAVGEKAATPVSQIDLTPTFLDWAGVAREPGATPHAVSLLDLDALAAMDRPVMAEYHANGSLSASVMLRDGRYKYIEYVGYRPQLFDLEADPHEHRDLARDPAHAEVVMTCARRLREICDPEQIDAAAKADQDRRVEEVGGLEAALTYTVNHTPPPKL